jgi:hypothetical protein
MMQSARFATSAWPEATSSTGAKPLLPVRVITAIRLSDR